ncbi:MAG: DUF6517 family protein [Halosimplex sp.]
MTRAREVGAALALVALLASAGCLGFLTGSKPLDVSANATEVSDSALQETGYRLADSGSPNSTLNVSVAGQNRTIEASSEIRQYNRTVSLGPVEGDFARFSVYTTPTVSIAGQTINPLADLSNERLVRRFVASTSGLSDVRFESNRTVRSLGAERNVSVYGATQTMEGVEANVTIDVATFEHDGDFVVAIAVHPERIDERPRVNALFEGLRHPAD